MLSIFSCVCWQSVYLLWRNVYLGLLPIFGLGCLAYVHIEAMNAESFQTLYQELMSDKNRNREAVILICISLMTNDAENLFMLLLALCISF